MPTRVPLSSLRWPLVAALGVVVVLLAARVAPLLVAQLAPGEATLDLELALDTADLSLGEHTVEVLAEQTTGQRVSERRTFVVTAPAGSPVAEPLPVPTAEPFPSPELAPEPSPAAASPTPEAVPSPSPPAASPTPTASPVAASSPVPSPSVAPVPSPSPAASPAATASPTPAGRPNIILILTDDQPPDINNMPTLQSLAGRGVTFLNMYVTVPYCCPSRASFLTGNLPERHGVLDNPPPAGGEQAFRDHGSDQSTVGTWLQEAGYATAYAGKYLTSYFDPAYVPPGWNFWFAQVASPGIGQYRNFAVSRNGTLVHFPFTGGVYSTDRYFLKGAQFIAQTLAHRPDRPFFLVVSPFAPHNRVPGDCPPGEACANGAVPAPRHRGSLDGTPIALPPDPPRAQLPPWLASAFPRSDADQERVRDLVRRRRESLRAVDEGIDRLLAVLAETGALDNTTLLYSSDNGVDFLHTTTKGVPYEDAIRVPLVIAGPAVAASMRGQSVSAPALNIDVAPTIAALAGVQLPPVDGESLAPFLRGDRPAWRASFPIALPRDIPPTFGNKPAFRGLVSGQYAEDGTLTPEWKYVEYPTRGVLQLFRLSADPHERRNLASQPQHEETQRQLAAQLREFFPDLPPP